MDSIHKYCLTANCSLVAVMLPPTFALSIFLVAAFTLLLGTAIPQNRNSGLNSMSLGMLLGWAWGCATMAAGLAVRSPTLLAQQKQKLQSSLVLMQTRSIVVVKMLKNVLVWYLAYLSTYKLKTKFFMVYFLTLGGYVSRRDKHSLIRLSTPKYRTSAVYGAFLFIGAFALGTIRAYAPNLALLSVFGGIVLVVVCPASVTLLLHR